MQTFGIHIEGMVQGVGFRPFVWNLARKYGLKGWVNNGSDGVHIRVSGEDAPLSQFVYDLKYDAPPNSRVKEVILSKRETEKFPDFRITESSPSETTRLYITPDLGLCPQCRQDIHNHGNHRKAYAFTTCLNCGPRYSITTALPYDRPGTTMAEMEMCAECEREYEDPSNRRFFSQTNSCPKCAVKMRLVDNGGSVLGDSQDLIIPYIVQALELGKIVAVKGIGGFLLMTDARNKESLRELRTRKNRPSKPLALIYGNEEMLLRDVFASQEELEEWNSIESPIVLFKLRDKPQSGIALDQVAPGLNRIGVMRPYAPILELISKGFGAPLVATSGNSSGSPIFYEDSQALKQLGNITDLFLFHERNIVIPQDDSLIAFTEAFKQKVFLRRSRGYAPSYINPTLSLPNNLLGTGAMLKSSFAMSHQNNFYISQYLGDSSNFDVQEAYRKVYDHLRTLLDFEPEQVIVDKHPDYFSRRFGEHIAYTKGISLIEVQHHKAHFGAVLAENHLLNSSKPTLGVIWDGTGYGDDGQSWGGEFFMFKDDQIQRIDHLDYFSQFPGDLMAQQPRLSALSVFGHLPGAKELLRSVFSTEEWDYYQKLLQQELGKSSSMGRLFDAVAGFLGFASKQSFEGEAAMQLQTWAEQYIDQHKDKVPAYPTNGTKWNSIVEGIFEDRIRGVSISEIAAKFHNSLVHMIDRVAEESNCENLAFSGGVFQNTLLIDLINEQLSKKYNLLFHKSLSPNDECVSLGQIVCASLELQHQFRSEKLKVQIH